jgi:hypothetical protein
MVVLALSIFFWVFIVGPAIVWLFRHRMIACRYMAANNGRGWKRTLLGVVFCLAAFAWVLLVAKVWPDSEEGSVWKILGVFIGSILIAMCGYYLFADLYYGLRTAVAEAGTKKS